jgi:hypothetical protein
LTASSATFLETKGVSPVGWSLKRLFQKRGIIVFTSNRMFFQSGFLSLYTLTYVLAVVASLFTFFITGEFIYLLAAAMCSMLVFQHSPFQRDIAFSDTTAAKLGSVRGMTGRGHLITVVANGRTAHIATLDLPDEVHHVLSSEESRTA